MKKTLEQGPKSLVHSQLLLNTLKLVALKRLAGHESHTFSARI